MNAAVFALIAVLAVGAMHAQQAVPAADDACAAHPQVSFEVATIKPSDASAGSSSMHFEPDAMTSTGVLRRLLVFAYDMRDFQLTGGPDWINTQPWKVQAKIDPPEPEFKTLDEAGAKALLGRLRQRVQSLIQERFQFKCHVAVKELPTYELVAAKGGAKLTDAAPGNRKHSIGTSGSRGKEDMKATGITVGELATALANQVGRTVIDKTGLTGLYDVRLSWSSAMASQETDTSAGPTIFTALDEQLGLKLVPAKGPVQVLVIDSVERPSDN